MNSFAATCLAFRSFLVLILISCSLWVAADVPNILLIYTDDLGFGDVGIYYQNLRRSQGLPGFHTPNLDQMAGEGVRMMRHYAPSPICAPARASLLTGRHQGLSEVRDNESLSNRPIEDDHTLATLLGGAGYATAAIGKWGVGGMAADNFPGHPLHRGFDFYFGPLQHADSHYHYPKEFNQSVYENFTRITPQLDKAYSTDLFTARAKKWIAEHHADSPEQPFFLYLAYTAPHARLEVPTQAYPAGGGLNGGLQWTGTPGAIINTASGSVNSWIHPDYTGQGWPNFAQRHATMVRRLDDAVGDLLHLLEDLDIADNTLIFFTSDNGPHHETGRGGNIEQDPSFFASYGPLDGTKRDVFEGGLRVPAILRWPEGLPAGRVSTHPSQQHDWLVTFAELAGVPAPFRADGVSLLNDLTGEGDLPATEIYTEYTTKFHYNVKNYADFLPSRRNRARGHMQAVYLEGYKGVRYNVLSQQDPFEVYETLNDPGETTNLAGQPGIPSQAEFEAKVLRMRRPHTGADPNESPARVYDTEAVPSVVLPGTRPGVRYEVFESEFPHLTSFTGLEPVAAGEAEALDLSVLTRPEDVGIRFQGWIHVPATGDYEFFLETDTGAGLRLHDILLLDADFGYVPGTELASGPIRLQAGLHPIRLHTRHSGAAPQLNLSWTGPGIAKESIPETAFVLDAPAGAPNAPPLSLTTVGPQPLQTAVLSPEAPDNWVAGIASPPENGTAEIVGNDVVYTPREGFYGQDRFFYTLSDGEESAQGLVEIEVLYVDPEQLWLPLDEGKGGTVHDAGGRAAGTLQGDPQWVEGISAHALHLNGSQDHVLVNSVFQAPAGAAPRTVSAWIRPEGQGTIAAWGEAQTGRKWHFRLDNNPGFVGHLRVEVEGGYRRGSTALDEDKWYHVAVVLPDGANNTNQIRLYVDGGEDTPYDTLAQTIDTTATPILIGTDTHPTPRFFPGRIDEVRILHRAMTAEEIAALAGTPNQTAFAWHLRHFGEAPISWMADDLGDGSSRLERLAMGWNPWSRNRPDGLRFETEDGDATVRYTRSGMAFLSVQHLVEGSEDLIGWEEVMVLETLQEDENGRVNVRKILPPGKNLQFYRLKFKLNP